MKKNIILGVVSVLITLASSQVVFADVDTSLAAINAGTAVFSDYAEAGVIGALSENKFTYDTLIALVRNDKGSDLTLSEIQTQVDDVNGIDVWTMATPSGFPRSHQTSVAYSGKIYSWGGGTGDVTNTMEIYDIVSDSWSIGTAGGTARNNHVSVIHDGKMYSWGGFDGFSCQNSLDIYNIMTDSWTTGTPGGVCRYESSAVVYDGQIFIWGGIDPANGGDRSNIVDIYEIATDSWSTGTSGGTPRHDHSATLFEGKMYVYGLPYDFSLGTSVDIYDIATDSWSTGTAGGTAREGHSAELYDGKIFFWGGTPTYGGRINTVDIYDIATDSWSTGTAGGVATMNHSSALYKGNMYLWGGETTVWIDTLRVYNVHLETALQKGLVAKDITTFSIPNATVTIAGSDIEVTVPFGADVTALVPSIVITGASVSPASDVAQDFSGPQTYVVTAKDGSTKEYTVTVTPAFLNSIAITTPANKLTYTVGESLDINGLIVTGTYSNGLTATELVLISNITGFDSSQPVSGQVLTITVGGKSTTYTVNIITPSTGGGGGSSSDNDAPQKTSVTISGGKQITNTQHVVLKLTARDESLPITMQVSNTSSFTSVPWVKFKTSYPWTLLSGNGSKIVYARFKDSKGNVSSVVNDSIRLQEPAGKVLAPQANHSMGVVKGVSAFKFLMDLSMGTQHSDVVELQKHLREDGLFTHPTNTGIFGPATFLAVQQFQQKYGINPTGYVGPITREKLNSMIMSEGDEIGLEEFVRLLIAINVIPPEKAELALSTLENL
jgi:hypothetical protein